MVDENDANYCAIKQVAGLDFMKSKVVSCQMHGKNDINKVSFRIGMIFGDELKISDTMGTIATMEQYNEQKDGWMKTLISSLT